MDDRRATAEQTLKSFLVRANKGPEVADTDGLFGDGIGLDSLETAELSALLEDDLGSDPFSEGLLPQTVGELLGYYQGQPQQS